MGDVQTTPSGEEERSEEDQMDVNNGDEVPTGEKAEELLREADNLLASPSTHKDPSFINDSSPKSHSTSVSSLVGNLTLTKGQIPGVPYSAVGDKIGITHRQSDLPPESTKSYGTGEGTVGACTGTGAGAGTCAQTGTGNNPGCVGKSLNFNLPVQKRSRSDTGSDMGSKTGHGFPPVYHNVRKTHEKANPYVEPPTIEGNR
jgi:hypothetical protein